MAAADGVAAPGGAVGCPVHATAGDRVGGGRRRAACACLPFRPIPRRAATRQTREMEPACQDDPARWTLPALLAQRAADRGAHVALRFVDGEAIDYATLAQRAARAGAFFAALGVGRGERVGVMLHNGPALIECWTGLASLGAVHVAVNPELSGEFLHHVLALTGVRVLVIDGVLLPVLEPLLARLPALETIVVDGAAPESFGRRVVDFAARRDLAPRAADAVAPQEIALVMTTSGTTGPAKAVLMPHAHCYLFGLGSVRAMGVGPTSVYYVVLPLFHANGLLMQLYASLIAGATAVVRPKFSASAWIDDIVRHGATHTNLLGVTSAFVLAQPPSALDRAHRLAAIGVAPNPPELDDRLRERFGVPDVIGMYGMTEVNIPLYTRRGEPAPGSCGVVLEDWFDLRIVDPDTDVERARGEVGEIVVRPKHPSGFMAGYLGMPEQTVEAWRNLWFHTGDAARMRADGHVEFVDRIKDCIRRRGENISSTQVEDAIARHPGIAEVAAVALPSDIPGGEDEIGLVVVPAADATIAPAELLVHARAVLPRFAQPRFLALVEALPKTPTGKVQKAKLKPVPAGARWIDLGA
jgi:crotonobetaine/carnitine-CoA ligase